MHPDKTCLKDQLQKVTELISLPEIYLKFNRLMDDTTADNEDFAQVVQMDPNLSAKLLQVANSAYFGFSGEIKSVSRAIKMLGIQQLHIMVLSISAVNALSALSFPKDIIDLKSFWRSSLLSAALARDIAQHLNLRPTDRFFILGMLHEIGHLVLYSSFADLARQTLEISKENEVSIAEAELQVLGCHYGQIGAGLMEQWKLPEDFQFLVRYQPTPGEAGKHRLEASLLHLAHAYAYAQFIDSEVEASTLVDPLAWEMTELDEESIAPIVAKALSTCVEMEKVILS